MENLYCRFCAELKNSDGLLDLECDDRKCEEIHIKLSFLNAVYVDVLSSGILPKTVCFVCYDSLNNAYDFLDKLKKAQEKLKLLTNCFQNDDDSKFDFEDDRAALDEFFNEPHEVPEVKEEISHTEQNLGSTSDVVVKLEPKEEVSDTSIQLYNNISVYKDTINIQDILDTQQIKNIPVEGILGSELIKKKSVKVLREVDKKTKSWKEFIWICALCDVEFTDLDVFRSHCKVTHNKCAAFTCIDCEKTLKVDSFESFVKHIRRHRKGLRNRCHYCDETVEPDTLKIHVKGHFKSLVVCSTCGELLANKETLHQHQTEYAEVKLKRKPRRKPGTPLTIEELTCHICKKVYKNGNSLRDHIKNMHTSERTRNYTCDRCGKAFLNKGTLTTHIMVHDQVRPHVCKICNKSFVFPNMLRRHVEMHSGVKPFSCEICGRNFRLQYQLNAHKIIHTDSMPYVCKYCNKAFRFKQILTNHERQHTGAKPYGCEHCCMEFANWSNYNKHMKRRHNLDTSKKKITPEGVFPINPETGQIIQVNMQGMEEWKTKIMIPGKRGKKKQVIKQETDHVSS